MPTVSALVRPFPSGFPRFIGDTACLICGSNNIHLREKVKKTCICAIFVVSSARPASGFPPNLRSHPAVRTQIKGFFLKKRTIVLCIGIPCNSRLCKHRLAPQNIPIHALNALFSQKNSFYLRMCNFCSNFVPDFETNPFNHYED